MASRMDLLVGQDGRFLGVEHEGLRQSIDMQWQNSVAGDDIYSAMTQGCIDPHQSSAVFQAGFLCYKKTVKDDLSQRLRPVLAKEDKAPEQMRGILSDLKNAIAGRNEEDIIATVKKIGDHITQARVILLLLAVDEYRDVGKKMLRSDDFIHARRILTATFVEGSAGEQVPLLDAETFRLEVPKSDVAGVFWTLGELKAKEPDRNNSLGLATARYSDDESLIKVDAIGFELDECSVMAFGLKEYLSAALENDSYILIRRSIENSCDDTPVPEKRPVVLPFMDLGELINNETGKSLREELEEEILEPENFEPTAKVEPISSEMEEDFRQAAEIMKQLGFDGSKKVPTGFSISFPNDGPPIYDFSNILLNLNNFINID